MVKSDGDHVLRETPCVCVLLGVQGAPLSLPPRACFITNSMVTALSSQRLLGGSQLTCECGQEFSAWGEDMITGHQRGWGRASSLSPPNFP